MCTDTNTRVSQHQQLIKINEPWAPYSSRRTYCSSKQAMVAYQPQTTPLPKLITKGREESNRWLLYPQVWLLQQPLTVRKKQVSIALPLVNQCAHTQKHATEHQDCNCTQHAARWNASGLKSTSSEFCCTQSATECHVCIALCKNEVVQRRPKVFFFTTS